MHACMFSLCVLRVRMFYLNLMYIHMYVCTRFGVTAYLLQEPLITENKPPTHRTHRMHRTSLPCASDGMTYRRLNGVHVSQAGLSRSRSCPSPRSVCADSKWESSPMRSMHSMRSMRGGFIFRNWGPSLKVHDGQCLASMTKDCPCYMARAPNWEK